MTRERRAGGRVEVPETVPDTTAAAAPEVVRVPGTHSPSSTPNGSGVGRGSGKGGGTGT